MTYLHPLALTHLDALWGLAALPLFWSHVRGLFFVPYENVLNRNVLVKAFYYSQQASSSYRDNSLGASA